MTNLRNLLHCFAMGMGIKAISSAFHVSRNTVRNLFLFRSLYSWFMTIQRQSASAKSREMMGKAFELAFKLLCAIFTHTPLITNQTALITRNLYYLKYRHQCAHVYVSANNIQNEAAGNCGFRTMRGRKLGFLPFRYFLPVAALP